MSRALKYDIPGPDWRVRPETIAERGWPAVFSSLLDSPLRLVVDVGYGRGEFLLELAQRDPHAAFVGIEYSYKRVLKMARRLARTKLENVRLLDCTAERAVAELFADASVSCFWINFPDPWPKKRHHRRRLVRPGGGLIRDRHAQQRQQAGKADAFEDGRHEEAAQHQRAVVGIGPGKDKQQVHGGRSADCSLSAALLHRQLGAGAVRA